MSDIIYNERWAQDMMDKYDAIRAENAALKRENEELRAAAAAAIPFLDEYRDEGPDGMTYKSDKLREVEANLQAALSRPSSSKAKQ